MIRFGRAHGRCEGCGWLYGQTVWHLGDVRWDAQAGVWRDGQGRRARFAPGAADVLGTVRTTWVILAAAHRNHDTADNTGANLAAWCQ